MLFRYYGSYEIGGCFAILLVNATEGYWDRLFSGQKDEKTPKAEKQAVEIKKHTVAKESKQSKKVYTKDTVKKSESKPKEDMGKTTTLDIISRAEDDIDQVEFSTQTIDMEQALREFEERYRKGGK